MKREDDPQKCYMGREIEAIRGRDIQVVRHETELAQVHMCVLPIACSPSQVAEGHMPKEYDMTVASGSDLRMEQQAPGGWSGWVVGKCSEWISTDSPKVFEDYRVFSLKALVKEMNWALHCGFHGCILPTPDYLCPTRYAKAIAPLLDGQIQFSVRIPLILPKEYFERFGGFVPELFKEYSKHVDEADPTAAARMKEQEEARLKKEEQAKTKKTDDGVVPMDVVPPAHFDAAEKKRYRLSKAPKGLDQVDGWRIWVNFKGLVDSNRLTVSLEMTPDLPKDPIFIQRWLAEPVKNLIIPEETFTYNSQNAIVLPPAQTRILLMMMQKGVHIILKVDRRCSSVRTDHDIANFELYRNYIWHVFQTRLPLLSKYEKFEYTYRNVLQHQVQPIQDKQGAVAYETLELDDVKYEKYEEAIKACVKDKIAKKPDPEEKLVLMVVGAGMGRLMSAALRAIRAAEADLNATTEMRDSVDLAERFRLIALEKNKRLVEALRGKVESAQKDEDKDHLLWKDVEVMKGDMRFWKPKDDTKADIVISELLGSFGDNELSPECLDGAQRFLKDDGITIPQQYTSFIHPVSCRTIWHKVRAEGEKGEKFLEYPFVVNLQSTYFPAVQNPQPVFTFIHSNPQKINLMSNSRNCLYKKIEFDMTTATHLHGMAGYFSAVLYGETELSILPGSKTPGLISWFPLFFPFRTPLALDQGKTIEFHIWRKDDERKVWYEWCLSGDDATPIHNPMACSHAILK
uniref:Protein arginine N-methyltransferase n=1 Tax=Chromera velia CCMP2878 TaxID=1169474 RepID=A0A0G4FEE7_9ALVE|mmetsp:Transcript_21353/g.42410  ORF Transcript_21353/g.42410 Transcript_21353/m.42410 type:complete len:742 (+) Transcript_21353:378-2603(+)|eukprot:Cvel_16585.t1-p1 / transcript=Cvel_16585.t1 / gene=Cvel_16585 / organism=Chromera_velia_CCMP2878 / gene_product=Protein arginine N-methyltransferase 5, putative / transcript_product=Protein arginine N-methyltransferase 5, putative / location=Cvel_scaffold1284:6506-13136(-) / protein_length=741 / sequence_SO=supercontig / SO=protein_coding / is_pseudo=false